MINKITIPINEVLLDPEDEYLRYAFSWSITKKGYFECTTGGKRVLLHRVILKAEDGQMIDHKNRNKLDNRKENLRFCTATQNQGNKEARKNTSSKYKGVSWHKRDKIWRATITMNCKTIHIGYFMNESDAALAYNEIAIKYFKEFAKLNEVN